MTADEVKKLFPYASPSTIARNRDPVPGLPDTQRKRAKEPALVGRPRKRQRGAPGLAICVEIISLRKRLLDSDNLVGGGKALRDAIAASLGLDDGDRRVKWNYHQLLTNGTPGTIVNISASRDSQT